MDTIKKTKKESVDIPVKTEQKPIFDSANVFTDLSGDFAFRLAQGQVFVFVGSKGSGKTSAVFAVLRACMDVKAFDRYELVIPNYEWEASDSYEWLEAYRKKNPKMIKVYDDYGEILSKQIVNDSKKEKLAGRCVRKLMIVEDATSAPLFHIDSKVFLKKMLTDARHYPCSLIFIVHSIKNVLSGIVRDNTMFVGITDIASDKLMHDLWQIWFSMVITYDEFLSTYKKHAQRDHGILLLYNNKNKKIDLNMLDWIAVKTALAKNLKCENKQSKIQSSLKLS